MVGDGSAEATTEILRRLSNIEKKVESLDETSAFAMRSNRAEHRKTLNEVFGKSKRRAQVYLTSNGQRSVNDIADLLDMQAPNVSIELTKLEKGGLLAVTTDGSSSYWNKKPIDSSLGISDFIMDKFKLNPDGTPAE